MLFVVYDFLKSVTITFDALQKQDAHMSQQVENLERLSLELLASCGATVDEENQEPGDDARVVQGTSSIKMGPYTVSANGLKQFVQAIGVDSYELYESLETSDERTKVLRATAVVYLCSLNGILKINAARNCYHQRFESVPAHTPLAMVGVPVLDFVRLVQKHKPRIVHTLGENTMQSIVDEHKALVAAVSREPRFKDRLEKDSESTSFNKIWQTASDRFWNLRQFAAGLATVMPTTSRVEADFSLINYRKDEFCTGLSDFSLEGVLFSRQRAELEAYLERVME